MSEKQSSSPDSIQHDLEEIAKIDSMISTSIKALKVISLRKFREAREKRKSHVRRIQQRGYGG